MEYRFYCVIDYYFLSYVTLTLIRPMSMMHLSRTSFGLTPRIPLTVTDTSEHICYYFSVVGSVW